MKPKKFDTVSFWFLPWTAGFLYTLGVWNQIVVSQPSDISFWGLIKGIYGIIMMFPFWPLVLAVLQNS